MLERCYSLKKHEKFPTYKGCVIDKRWHNFQNFAKWFKENYNSETMQGWHLYKDILVKGNKVYSPETCCFVPFEINTLILTNKGKRASLPIGIISSKNKKSFISRFNILGIKKHIGVYSTVEEAFEAYKEAKENYIKEFADKWKDLIDSRVYQALQEYQVEITD